MKIADSLRWWLRGLQALRHPSLVRALGELKAERDLIEAVRSHYADQRLKLAPSVSLENWAPQRLAVGEAVAVEHGTILSWPGEHDAYIEIGAHTWIGPYNNLRTAPSGRIRIGSYCLISQFCTLITHNHGHARERTIQSQGIEAAPCDVLIGDDVWLGAGTVLLPGVRIGRGAIIGAGSVVTAEVPSFEIWAGVPARRIGAR